jgi:feruloyl esterase
MEAEYVSVLNLVVERKLTECAFYYYGQTDAVIASENSPVYYNLVPRTMGLNSSDLNEFYHFFRISGMGHCGGGDGAFFIGNQLTSVSTMDPQNNVLLRIVDWVENRNAPETVAGTKFVNVSVKEVENCVGFTDYNNIG